MSTSPAKGRSCRSCGAALEHTFVDLGLSPLANSYLEVAQLDRPEPHYPLHVYVCGECLLVQLEALETPEHLFTDYAYFSSYSESWLRHAEALARKATTRFDLGARSQVVEIASNDGYLLQYFVALGIPVQGIEPAANVAQAALDRGIPTLVRFFDQTLAAELAAQGRQADLLVGNNVLAHVPDLNGFVAGLKLALKPRGVVIMEFPHLMRLMAENQFDTIYHEHFSYFSFLAVRAVFARRGLEVWDVEELPTHGGSLRIYARHHEDDSRPITAAVQELAAREEIAGFTRLGSYLSFAGQVERVKRQLLDFLRSAKRAGRSIAAYGAPAKGNTLLNYCGIDTALIDYTVDRSPHKQGRFLPGSRIPIHGPERIAQTRPDYVLILPWNLKEEVMGQTAYIREWGGQFVLPIPQVQVLP